MKQNELTEKEITQLRADLQDLHHYAGLISGCAWSTFDGAGGYCGLRGKMTAYENLYNRITCYQRDDIRALQAFSELDLICPESIENSSELKREARRAFRAVADVARRYETDPHSGARLT